MIGDGVPAEAGDADLSQPADRRGVPVVDEEAGAGIHLAMRAISSPVR